MANPDPRPKKLFIMIYLNEIAVDLTGTFSYQKLKIIFLALLLRHMSFTLVYVLLHGGNGTKLTKSKSTVTGALPSTVPAVISCQDWLSINMTTATYMA